MTEKVNIKFRVPLLDMSFLYEQPQLPRSREVGNFVCLQVSGHSAVSIVMMIARRRRKGTVIRTGMLKTLEYERAFQCTMCKYVFTSAADVEQYHRFPEHKHCPSLSDPPCKGKSFRYVEGSAKMKV